MKTILFLFAFDFNVMCGLFALRNVGGPRAMGIFKNMTGADQELDGVQQRSLLDFRICGVYLETGF